MTGHNNRATNRERVHLGRLAAARTPTERAGAAFNWWRATFHSAPAGTVHRAAEELVAFIQAQITHFNTTDTYTGPTGQQMAPVELDVDRGREVR